MKMMVFAHLLNDFSGSPRVLRAAITALAAPTAPAILYIGSSGTGVLSASDIPLRTYPYCRTRWRPLTLIAYFTSQLLLLVRLLFARDIHNRALIYVNTLLPFGAALFGWLTRRKVIYHIHEVSITPTPLRWWLVSIARLTSSLNLYVSDAHRAALPIPGVPARKLYNALDAAFADRASQIQYSHQNSGVFHVLMIASLRDYKGIPELLDLANRLADHTAIRFDLVVNEEIPAIRRYFREHETPRNLIVHPRVADTAPFYERASLLLNLSRVDLWVETFGLTILEAMAYGIPVIAPPAGGPAELVENGVHGYLIDSRNLDALHQAVLRLYGDPVLCRELSANCRSRASVFSEQDFASALRDAVKEVLTH